VEDGFSGWARFTGGLMVLVGLFQVITGILALAGSGYYTVPPATSSSMPATPPGAGSI
jgi:hypothetical protein